MDPCREARLRFNPSKASRAQELLSKLVKVEDDYGVIERVGGLDVSYFKDGSLGLGVLVVLKYPELSAVKCFYAVKRACIPYIPGLLAFREMEILTPLLSKALADERVDLLVVDGHGIAHPRKAGIASHIGLAFNKPSIGVAKRILAGKEEPVGARRLIIYKGEIVGGVLEAGDWKIYVSPGHRISVETALKLVATMIKKNEKMPEPTRLADSISRKLRDTVKTEKIGECKIL